MLTIALSTSPSWHLLVDRDSIVDSKETFLKVLFKDLSTFDKGQIVMARHMGQAFQQPQFLQWMFLVYSGQYLSRK